MHDNRNKEVIKRVEKGMMKANRTRNIFAIVAVALTTFMITTVFSLGINYKENMELTSGSYFRYECKCYTCHADKRSGKRNP